MEKLSFCYKDNIVSTLSKSAIETSMIEIFHMNSFEKMQDYFLVLSFMSLG